jgi:CBS domain-containing protein
MRVSDIATLDARSCRPETNLAAIAAIMWEQDCGVVPVVDEAGRVVGVVTDRDICMAVGTRGQLASQIAAGQVMSGKAHTCRLTDDPRTALRTMSAGSVRRLPVVDEKGNLAGMVSLTDLVLASRDPKVAKPGELTWGEVVPMIGAICRPRTLKETAPELRRQAIAAVPKP